MNYGEQPMVVLVRRLRTIGFTVESATEELGAREPVMKITAPDGYTLLNWESDYFRDPRGTVSRLRHHLRSRGYSV